MAGKHTKKYKSYLQDPSNPVPKTSAWRCSRKEKHVNTSVSSNNDSSPVIKFSEMRKRRRLYNIDASVSIPRQTMWRWKKIYNNFILLLMKIIIKVTVPLMLINHVLTMKLRIYVVANLVTLTKAAISMTAVILMTTVGLMM